MRTECHVWLCLSSLPTHLQKIFFFQGWTSYCFYVLAWWVGRQLSQWEAVGSNSRGFPAVHTVVLHVSSKHRKPCATKSVWTEEGKQDLLTFTILIAFISSASAKPNLIWSIQSNCGPQPPVIANKVLLEHSHTQSVSGYSPHFLSQPLKAWGCVIHAVLSKQGLLSTWPCVSCSHFSEIQPF
jgi:hypothetical protein